MHHLSVRVIIGFFLLTSLNFNLQAATKRSSSIGPKFPTMIEWKKSDEWSNIYKMIDEQKFTKALKEVDENLEKYIEDKDEKNWTIALLTRQNLLNALHNVERSVNEFKTAIWPKSLSSQVLLHLYYAQTLTNYYQYYSWEINKREQIVSKKKVDLKHWTKNQIYKEIQTTLNIIWEQRKELGNTKTDFFKAYIHEGPYPRVVRGTIRDSFTYFYVKFLENSIFWSAKHSNEKSLIKLKNILEIPKKNANKKYLLDMQVHPLKKISAILSDLEKWHWGNDRLSALMEARFEKVRVLKKHFKKDYQGKIFDQQLKEFMRDYKSDSWWSEGMYLRASIRNGMKHDTANIEAREMAISGKMAHPKSIGAARCNHLVTLIEMPQLEMSAMNYDFTKKRSIQITHKNWKKVYFRAYKFNPVKYLLSQKDYRVYPYHTDILKILKNKKPTFSWDADLINTGDFKAHKTYLEPKIENKGFYIIMASANGDFKETQNKVVYDFYQQTDLFLLKNFKKDSFHFEISDAKLNKPIKGATLSIYKLDWKKGHKLYKTIKTDKNGKIVLKKNKDKDSRVIFTVKNKKDILFDPEQSYLNQQIYQKSSSLQSLIITDRSIFRPNQVIQFKVITYENRVNKNKPPGPKPNSHVEVSLMDGNREIVKTIKIKTNSFASGSGEFQIPGGRALGNWRIETKNYVGSKNIKVEEYKRPTFLAELGNAKGEVKLNKMARFNGSAKYYFGLPVSGARVKYSIRRSANYPYWYYWWYPYTNRQSQIVKTGNSKTDKEGKYIVEFTPRAAVGEGTSGITYNYSISVEVLNEGGETVRVSKTFIIGKVAVKASISTGSNFSLGNASFSIFRTDLNGKALKGNAQYSLYKLKQPGKTLAPSEQAKYYGKNKPKKGKYKLDGDFKRARWEGFLNAPSILKSWDSGKLVITKELIHDESGQSKIELTKLKPGAYRIVYNTKDSFGSSYETNHEFLVLSSKSKLKLPIILLTNKYSSFVGDEIKFFIHSGYKGQQLKFEVTHFDKVILSKTFVGGKDKTLINLKVTKKHLGGISAKLYGVNDHTFMYENLNVSVPYVSKTLNLGMERIRKLIYPGTKETWKIKVWEKNRNGKNKKLAKKAEVAAYMYDKSLDAFTTHGVPYISYPYSHSMENFTHPNYRGSSNGLFSHWYSVSSMPTLYLDQIRVYSAYGIGGMGRRGRFNIGNTKNSMGFGGKKHRKAKKSRAKVVSSKDAPSSSPIVSEEMAMSESKEMDSKKDEQVNTQTKPKKQIRSNFSETGFWKPSLITDKNGEVKFSFLVPDSLTSWNVWAHAITKDFKYGSNSVVVESSKDLMVRTYFPRFMRQGDIIKLKVVVDNTGTKDLKGKFFFNLKNLENTNLGADFKLPKKFETGVLLNLKAKSSINYTVEVNVPNYLLGSVKLKAFAKTDEFTDGEEKEINILPSRVHLIQSKFISLKNKEKRTIRFEDMLKEDKSRINDSLVVKLDGQLFYSLLSSLPYISDYPYKSTEQFLSTFVSTSIINSTYKKFPSIVKMAKKMSKRKTQYEKWNENDPNRKMKLVETPWLDTAKGGTTTDDLLNVLKPEVTQAVMKKNLKEIKDSQTSIGAFPWFKGGPPSFFMTISVLNGFSRVAEFDGEIPKNVIKKAWDYVGSETKKMISWCMGHDSCFELITFVNFTLSNYKDSSLYDEFISPDFRKTMLEFSFKHWKRHSPQLKGMLSLLLSRMERSDDALLVFDSVMDSAKTQKDLGTFWAPESKSWLWYNDTVETHSYALRTLMELKPKDEHRHGLVQWLYLNKKLNHWKSTRATAEVIYSVLHYLKVEKLVSSKEEIEVKVGETKKTFEFLPEKYTGKDNFIVIKGADILPKKMNEIEFTQKTKGISFASATWHYSTEVIPSKAKGDLLKVTRKFYKRLKTGTEVKLLPLEEGVIVEVGDQIEVHLTINAKHTAEYIHLRDPRPSGFEPETLTSGYKWDLGVVRYEEIRDSGMNFFFEKLPVGEYTLKHRIRVNMAGTFRTHPATLKSLYAPEFNAFSSGKIISIK